MSQLRLGYEQSIWFVPWSSLQIRDRSSATCVGIDLVILLVGNRRVGNGDLGCCPGAVGAEAGELNRRVLGAEIDRLGVAIFVGFYPRAFDDLRLRPQQEQLAERACRGHELRRDRD